MPSRKKAGSAAETLAGMLAYVQPVDGVPGVFVRELSQIETEQAHDIDPAAGPTAPSFSVRVMAASLCEEDGTPVFVKPFDPKVLAQLQNLPRTRFEAIGRAALRLNDLLPPDDEGSPEGN